MHRNHLKTLIEEYFPSDLEEQSYKNRFLKLLADRPDCFYRTCFEPGHITASAWVLNHTEEKVLLMHHRKLDGWFQPGGHCDGDPNVLAVALKEVGEETGLEEIEPVSAAIFDLDIHEIPAIGKEPPHYHYDVRFLVRCKKDMAFTKNHESKALQWFGKEKSALPNQQRSILRLLDKWVLKTGGHSCKELSL